MTTYHVKDREIFELLQKHEFKRSNPLLNEIITYFETKFSIVINKPIDSDLKRRLLSRIAKLVRSRKPRKSGKKYIKFQESLDNSFFELSLTEETSKPTTADNYRKKLIQDNHDLRREVDSLKRRLGPRMVIKRKNYFECTNHQQKRIKKNISEDLKTWLNSYGFQPNKLIAYEKKDDVGADDDKKHKPSIHILKERLPEIDIKEYINVKDFLGLSDKSYTMLREKFAPNWPSIHYLREKRNELQNIFNVTLIPNGAITSFKAKLLHIINISPMNYVNASSIKIKFAADGTNIGRNLKLLNVTFTILNEGDVAKTSKGNYSIGMFEYLKSENYESIKECFHQMNAEIEELSCIKVNEKKIKIEYFICSDMKMILNLLGMLSANSSYPCAWCKCHKDEFHNTTKKWSLKDRSLSELMEYIDEDCRDKVKFSYNRKPLLTPKIPISNYVLCMLHLFLRISDKLFSLLVGELISMDEIKITHASQFDIKKYKHLKRLEDELNKTCKMKFSFFVSQNSVKIEWKSLTGPDYHKIFTNMRLCMIIGNHKNFELIQRIWDNFYDIYMRVKGNEISHEDLEIEACQWLDDYLKVYKRGDVTPYIHIFVSHLYQFIELYQDVNQFSTEGLERMNGLCTKYYFNGTNKRDNVLQQLMNKRNRMELCEMSLNNSNINEDGADNMLEDEVDD